MPFKEIKSIIPSYIYKKQKNSKWEEQILEKWKEFSSKLSDSEEGVKTFLGMIAEKNYYGCNLFWMENYYKNKQKWLKKNMWLIVKYDKVVLTDDKITQEIR